jgi:S-adenosylmethionine hydrolase
MVHPIALLTDFGTDDFFVGAMKGVILSINPRASIVDITHNVKPQDIRSAAFLLSSCRRDFPVGTIFVSVVDPGVGSSRRAIAAAAEGKVFVAPDNGLLSFILNDQHRDARVFELRDERFFNHPVSRTFHGRDIFAPVAAHLSNGVPIEEFGPAVTDFVCFETAGPKALDTENRDGEVIHIDRFGNVITNLTQSDLPSGFSIDVNGRHVDRLAEYYSNEREGELFAIFGSTGFLEISVNRGSAAELLGAVVGDRIAVRSIR